jgi:outer membrane protein assembly factor BamB
VPRHSAQLSRRARPRTGHTIWRFRAGVVETPPLLAGGRVYFGAPASNVQRTAPVACESNPHARRTYAVNARTGCLVWRFPDGEYSPVIAGRERVYLTGYTSLYGLVPRVR